MPRLRLLAPPAGRASRKDCASVILYTAEQATQVKAGWLSACIAAAAMHLQLSPCPAAPRPALQPPTQARMHTRTQPPPPTPPQPPALPELLGAAAIPQT